MYHRFIALGFWGLLGSAVLLVLEACGETPLIQFADNGLLEGLVVDGKTVLCASQKGFYALPAVGTGKADFFTGTFARGKLDLATGSGVKLTATVTHGNGCVEIAGHIEKESKGDRAVWLVFELPSPAEDWRIEDSMDNRSQYSGESYKRQALSKLDVTGNNIFPMIVGVAKSGAIGIALAPDTPCIFVTDGGKDRLAVRIALGLSDATTRMTNKAPFKILVYDLEPEWGFRGLLEKYYNNYPEYYETTPRKVKLFNHHHDWLREGRIENKEQHLIDPNKQEHTYYFKTSCRIKELGDTETIGRRVDDLEKLIKGHTHFHIQVSRNAEPGDPAAIPARQRVLNSMNHSCDGTAPVILKKNEIDIPHNADPDLFADKGLPTMGSWYMDFVKRSSTLADFAIMHWDRFGGWGNALNYRRDHFAYLDFPLTFDTEGRVCIHTKFTYWKLMKRLREWGMKNNEFSQEVAGLKVYGTDNKFSQPAGFQKDGRFFTGAVVDAGWHEGSMKPIELGGMDTERVFVGRKSYRISTGNIVEHELEPTLERAKLALAQTSFYGFACPVQTQYFFPPEHPGHLEGYSYYTKPDHKALWDKYLPAVEAIRLAGWEPVTHAWPVADVQKRTFAIERFGESGRSEIYLTVWGPDPPEVATLVVDYKKMGFTSLPQVTELVSDIRVQASKKEGKAVLNLGMEKNMTRILKLAK